MIPQDLGRCLWAAATLQETAPEVRDPVQAAVGSDSFQDLERGCNEGLTTEQHTT